MYLTPSCFSLTDVWYVCWQFLQHEVVLKNGITLLQVLDRKIWWSLKHSTRTFGMSLTPLGSFTGFPWQNFNLSKNVTNASMFLSVHLKLPGKPYNAKSISFPPMEICILCCSDCKVRRTFTYKSWPLTVYLVGKTSSVFPSPICIGWKLWDFSLSMVADSDTTDW